MLDPYMSAHTCRRQAQLNAQRQASGKHCPRTLKPPAMICRSSSRYRATCRNGKAAVVSAQRHKARHVFGDDAAPAHLDAAVLHDLILSVDHVLRLPAQLLFDVVLQVLDDAQAHLGLGAVGVHDGHVANLASREAQVAVSTAQQMPLVALNARAGGPLLLLFAPGV